MPRSETPLELDGRPLTEFAVELRKLRQKAGGPSYRELARRAHFSSTTLSDAAAGKRMPSLAVTIAYVRACDGDIAEWERRWHTVAATSTQHPDTAPVTGDAHVGAGAPYAGLSAYQFEDAEWFFGREALADELVRRLAGHRFVAVVGPSGAGKSSLLRAGLLPRLASTASRIALLITPGVHPVEECAIQLAQSLGTMPGAVVAELWDDPRNLHRIIRQKISTDRGNNEVVLVVDQFEELFTLCRDPAERSLFIAALMQATQDVDSNLRVVLGVRADFYSHCLLEADLAPLLNDGHLAVGPMSADELRRVIVGPARRAACTVENSLLATLIAQASGAASVLPLLSHALLQTWHHRQGNTLTLAGYQRAGGIDGALANTAERVFTSFDPDQQETVRALFLRLVELGEGTQDTKRRVERTEIGADADSILNTLAEARLVVLSESSVELAHEALISAWPRLRAWLMHDREGQRVHRQLTEATAIWIEHNRDPGTLLRGARLGIIRDWARHHGGATRAEQDLLAASIAADTHQRATARKRVRTLRGLVALLAVLTLVASAAAVYAINSQQTAQRQRNIAVALNAVRDANALIDTNPALAAQLSLVAYRLHPSEITRNSLIATSAAATKIPLSVATNLWSIAPNAQLVAAGDRTNDITVLSAIEIGSVTTEARIAGGHVPPSFGPESRTLLTVDRDATGRLWDISDPARPILRATLPEKVLDHEISPDGSLLVTNDATEAPIDPNGPPIRWANGRAGRLWDISDLARPRLLATLPDTSAEIFAFGVNRQVLATIDIGLGSTPRTLLWNIADPRHPRLVGRLSPRTNGRIVTAAFVSNDQVLITGSDAGDTIVWDITQRDTPRTAATITDPERTQVALAVSPDQRWLARTGGLESDPVVWDLTVPSSPVKALELPRIDSAWMVPSFSPESQELQAVVIKQANSSPPVHLVRWRLNVDDAAADVCTKVIPPITELDWAAHFNDVPYQSPCE